MGQDNQEGLKKTLDFSRAIGILFYLLNIYWYCHTFFTGILPQGITDKSYQFLHMVNQRIHLFGSIYITLLIALLFIAFYGWAERGRRRRRSN